MAKPVAKTRGPGLATVPAVDRALVDNGYKGKLGAPAFSTLVHRVAVPSKTHQLAQQVNPCGDALVRELLAKTRRAYAKRGALPPDAALAAKLMAAVDAARQRCELSDSSASELSAD